MTGITSMRTIEHKQTKQLRFFREMQHDLVGQVLVQIEPVNNEPMIKITFQPHVIATGLINARITLPDLVLDSSPFKAHKQLCEWLSSASDAALKKMVDRVVEHGLLKLFEFEHKEEQEQEPEIGETEQYHEPRVLH